MMDGMGAGVMAIGMIIMLVVLGLAIAGVVWFVRALGDRHQPPAVEPQPEGPREILQRRYAAGEIDEDEYFRRISGIDQL